MDDGEYILSDPEYNEDYLIAHTFVITSPGVYYMGSSYGSVAISYISIDNMAEGEAAGGMGFGDDFSIDFCHGGIGFETSAEFDAENSDAVLADLAYVGSDDWYHSNIFPMFINGSSSNLTDYIDIGVTRVLNSATNISTVNITAHSKARIAGGILYTNNNSISQRAARKVSFNVYCEGLAAGVSPTDATVYWTASRDESASRYRLYSNHTFNAALSYNFFLTVDAGKPTLGAAGAYYWTCDADGRLKNQDGSYLTYSAGAFTLQPDASADTVCVYYYDGGIQVLATDFINGGVYFLKTAGGDMVVIKPTP